MIPLSEEQKANLKSHIEKYVELGLSLLPADHEKKGPLYQLLPEVESVKGERKKSWKPYQRQRASLEEVLAWVDNGAQGVAAICGSISNNRYVFDIESVAISQKWLEQCEPWVRELIAARSDKGVHIHFECEESLKSEVLARFEDGNVAIELLGENHLCTLPPSRHPKGTFYRWDNGVPAAFPRLSVEQVEHMKAVARQLCNSPIPRDKEKQATSKAKAWKRTVQKFAGEKSVSVIDEFNKAYSVAQLLEQNGYTARGNRFVRPDGKSPSVSIIDGKSYHHSTSDPLSNGRFNDAFSIYCELEHNGNIKDAVKSAAKGLGLDYKVTKSKQKSEAVLEEVLKARTVLDLYNVEAPFPYSTFVERPGGGYRTVFIKNEEELVSITHCPLWISSRVVNLRGEICGCLVMWQDQKGKARWSVLRNSDYMGNRADQLLALADRGLQFVPSQLRKVKDYLAAFSPDAEVFWCDKIVNELILGKWLIAMPYGLFIEGKDAASIIPLIQQQEELPGHPEQQSHGIWQPADSLPIWDSLMIPSLEVATTESEDWLFRKEFVRKLTVFQDGDNQVSFALRSLAALVPLYSVVRPMTLWEGFGIHFFGQSSTGKTTILQFSASFVGCGRRPGHPNSYITTWKATDNGLEAFARNLFGLPLILDELGVGMSATAGQSIYQLISGESKNRANSSGRLADSDKFMIVILSSGEVCVKDFLESEGVYIKEGQRIRLVDVPVDDSLWKGQDEVEEVQQHCAEYWGYELPRLVVSLLSNRSEQIQKLVSFKDEAKTALRKALPKSSPAARRVQDYFAGMSAVGEFAVEEGVLAWPRGYATKMMCLLSKEVICNEPLTEGELALETLRNNLLEMLHLHFEIRERSGAGNTLQTEILNQDPKRELYGAYDKEQGVIGILPRALSSLSGGRDKTVVAKVLLKAGLLAKRKDKGYQVQFRVGGNYPNVYLVKDEILTLGGDCHTEPSKS